MVLYTISAQSDSTVVNWSIDFELGYGTVLGSNGKPPNIQCIEGCTPISSTGDFKTKRIGLFVDWNDKDAISFSGAIVDFEFDRFYKDDLGGGVFGYEWDIRFLDLQLAYLKTFWTVKNWSGRAEIGASYSINIKESDSLTATPRNTFNVSVGGRVEYNLNNGKRLFARVIATHSLRNNLEYFADTASLKVDKFAPLYATLGIQFHL